MKEELSNDSVSKLYGCKLCEFTINDEEKFQVHLQVYHQITQHGALQDYPLTSIKVEPSLSELDKEIGNNLSILEPKVTIKYEEEDYESEEEYVNKESISQHKYEKSEWTSIYSCSHCKKEMSSQKKLRDHIRLQHKGQVQCDECAKWFKNIYIMKRHKWIHGEPQFNCDICGKLFREPLQVKEHKEFVHENIKFTCKPCGKDFSNKKNLKTHEKAFHINPQDTSDDVHPCSECGKQFITSLLLKMHERRHNTIHTCEECGVSYKSKDSLKAHMATTHRGEKHLECDQCGKCFTRVTSLNRHKLRVHEKIIDPSVRVQCDECGKWLHGARSLQRHKWQHGDPQFKCDLCQELFKEPDQLKDHHQIVHENKPVLCEPCGKEFSSNKSLKLHNNNFHPTDPATHICSECGKHFNTGAMLRKHEKRHTLYKCETCGSSTTTKASLQLHIATVHRGEKSLDCDECGKQFTKILNLRIHKRLHSNSPKTFHCNYCDSVYVDKRNLANHISRNHSSEATSSMLQPAIQNPVRHSNNGGLVLREQSVVSTRNEKEPEYEYRSDSQTLGRDQIYLPAPEWNDPGKYHPWNTYDSNKAANQI